MIWDWVSWIMRGRGITAPYLRMDKLVLVNLTQWLVTEPTKVRNCKCL